jgi:metallophosphoesterase superfamily enzyme
MEARAGIDPSDCLVRDPGRCQSEPEVMAERFQLQKDVVLDARRAVWLPRSRCLAVGDLHLGEAWARRARGQLVPLSGGDSAVARLKSLLEDYRPERLVLLGDIVHAALPLEGIRSAVTDLASLEREGLTLDLCLGNHDRHLPRQLERWGLRWKTVSQIALPEAVLFHGDVPVAPPSSPAADGRERWRIQGHLHPALVLDDGVASRVKVPCFLVAPGRLVLPAFSEMAAGVAVDRSGLVQDAGETLRFESAVACLGPRLLRIPFAR